MKTVNELRDEFECMAKSCKFDIERLPSGEYKSAGRNTFIFWCGYWECAKINGIILVDSDILKMHDF